MKSALLIEVLRASARLATGTGGALRISKGVTRKRSHDSILRHDSLKTMPAAYQALE
jgi:hypothetical protein